MIISLASGKGGTGKTTIAVNLALALALSTQVQLVDADVEEPNAHVFLSPVFSRTHEVNLLIPRIRKASCNLCGMCQRVCSFGAMAVLGDRALVLPELCHGCGGCSLLCPQQAIEEAPRLLGLVQQGKAHGLDFLMGTLKVGRALAPPIIERIKELVLPGMEVIVDCSPGSSCSMVSAVRGSDLCLLVVEPSPFGLHDLDLAYRVTRKLGLSAGLIINRQEMKYSPLEEYAEEKGLPILARFPYDRQMATLSAQGRLPYLDLPPWREKFTLLAQRLLQMKEEVRERGRRPW